MQAYLRKPGSGQADITSQALSPITISSQPPHTPLPHTPLPHHFPPQDLKPYLLTHHFLTHHFLTTSHLKISSFPSSHTTSSHATSSPLAISSLPSSHTAFSLTTSSPLSTSRSQAFPPHTPLPHAPLPHTPISHHLPPQALPPHTCMPASTTSSQTWGTHLSATRLSTRDLYTIVRSKAPQAAKLEALTCQQRGTLTWDTHLRHSLETSVVHLTLDGVNGKWRWRRNLCQIDGENSKLRRQSPEFSDGNAVIYDRNLRCHF